MDQKSLLMKQRPASEQKNIPLRAKIESQLKYWMNRTRALNGEPRYVAMGMAVGIFVSATPTIPFQTLIAVALCLIVRGSKSAAAVGVWLSNPVTFPVFYLASYKTGTVLFGISNGHEIASYAASDLLKLGVDITVAAMVGGIIIGIILGVIAYLFTYKAVTKIRSREKRQKRLLGRRKKTEGKGQTAESRSLRADNTGQQTDAEDQVTDTRSKVAPAMISDPNDPACENSTTIFCRSETKDQRP